MPARTLRRRARRAAIRSTPNTAMNAARATTGTSVCRVATQTTPTRTAHRLQAECFFCHRFRVPEFDVIRYQQALRLVDCGLIGEALRFLDMVANARGQDMRSRRRRDANETVINDIPLMLDHIDMQLRRRGDDRDTGAASVSAHVNGSGDDFLKPVFDVRNEICKQALRSFREFGNVCAHCQGISPRITTKNGHLFFYFNKKNADFNVANGNG
ncbi:hypothetical protein, conserved, partial [Leishmania shawi]